ncbi:hypothetical protein RBH29_07135 [Herbivorax sp. ANBcel31]|uniref:hypothetical protein n=1 Tax=Herbivorax sp. ANBcel31 TaxID=3069754 RepID=UPI0027B430F1|nr:hypothetical protein [Herbivorax sp. ANBcel31]MDQ2086202.1 hypothetical protein [Herbivorax sp. ANBcel31]
MINLLSSEKMRQIKINIMYFNKKEQIDKCKVVISFIVMSLFLLSFFSTSPVLAYDEPPDDENEIREKLSDIVSSHEITRETEDDNFINALRRSIIRYIIRNYEDFMERFGIDGRMGELMEAANVPSWAVTLIKYISIALIIFVIFVIGYYIFKNRFISKKIMRDNEDILVKIKNPDEILKIVEKHIAKRDYNSALRFLYIASLINLNNSNIIKINKAKTNKQYLLEIQLNKPELFDIFTNFTQDFNKYCYGWKTLNTKKFQRWYETYFKLIDKKGGEKN